MMERRAAVVHGKTTSDAESQRSKSGGVYYAVFSVAVSESKARVICFPVVAFGKLATLAESHVTTGRQVLVEGRIEVGDKNRFNVMADRIRLDVPTGEQPERIKNTK